MATKKQLEAYLAHWRESNAIQRDTIGLLERNLAAAGSSVASMETIIRQQTDLLRLHGIEPPYELPWLTLH